MSRRIGGLSGRARTTALIIASALFMEQLDSTVLTTALPTMARSFGVDPLHMSAALTSYLVGLAVFIPASGRLADRLGSRSVFRAAIALFLLGSVLCAQAPNLPFLVTARLLQGAGGAMMVPVGRLVLLRTVSKSELVSATFWMLLPATIGPLCGPIVGGFLTTYLSWRWIFYINVPVGLLGMALTTRFIPQLRETVRSAFDLRGAVLSGTSLACLIFGLESASLGTGALGRTLAILGVGFLSALLYSLHARVARDPILDFGLMRIATFRLSVLAGSLTRIAAGAAPFLIPSMLQLGFGMSAAQSGLITFTAPLGGLSMRFWARGVLRRHGFRSAMTANGAIGAILMLVCAALRPGWPFWAISGVLFLIGMAQALQFTAYNTIAYADVPTAQLSAATSFYATFQQMTLTLGICIAVASMAIARAASGRDRLDLTDFSVGFLTVGALALFAAPVASRLASDAGSELSGHGKAPAS
ncbi:MFS transporter [Lichenicoccus sp.]|uniref:MFS transporter n=1 Tax=Lichenicoccus sp. TaxID=2781899 RepID=UPI003D0C23A9